MKIPKAFQLFILPILSLAFATQIQAALVNNSFESSLRFLQGFAGGAFYSGNDPANNVAGWDISIPPGGFDGTANYNAVTGLDGSVAAYISNGATFATNSNAYETVTAGTLYALTGFARVDGTTVGSGSLTLSFYDSVGVFLSSNTSLFNLPASLGNGGSNPSPFLLQTVSLLAPTNAAFAGVTYVNTGSSYHNIDNFAINPVPEPSTYVLIGLAGVACFVLKRKKALRA